MDAQHIKKMIGNGLRSVRQALRGNLTLSDASKQVLRVQADGMVGETFNGAEYFQHAGFRSKPVAGMQPIIIPLNGKSANGVVIACSNGTLFITDLAEGEVAIFNERDGVANSVILRNGKVIDMRCDVLNINAATEVNITTPDVKINASNKVQITTPTTNTSDKLVVGGDAQVAKKTTTLTLNVTSPVAGASVMAGGITANGEIISSGISLPNHTHSGVQAGAANTGAPH